MDVALYGVDWIPKSLVTSFLKTKWELLEYKSVEVELEEIKQRKPTVVLSFLPPPKIRGLESIQYIITPGAGIDVLPLEEIEASGKNIINCHANSNTVAEHAWALMMAASRKLVKYHNLVTEIAKWPPRSQVKDYSTDLTGKTLGIIGYGSIGRKLEKIAFAFDMDVMIFRKHPNEEQYSLKNIDEMIEELDFLVLACALTSETRGIISKELIAKSASHLIVVNIARGELIDEPALIEALLAGKIRAAALDVWQNSPYGYSKSGITPEDFVGTPNLLISPHRAWVSTESTAAVAKQLAKELDLIAMNKKSENLVDISRGY